MHGGVHCQDEWLRVETDPQNEYEQRREREDFADVQVGGAAVVGIVGAAVNQALEHPEIVSGRSDDAGHDTEDEDRGNLEAAGEDEEFTDEAVGAGETERREA